MSEDVWDSILSENGIENIENGQSPCCNSCETYNAELFEYEVTIDPLSLEKEKFKYCDLCSESKVSIFSRAIYPISNKEVVKLICFVGNKILNAINERSGK